MSVYNEVMGCNTELCTTIVVTSMSTNCGYEFNLSGFRWDSDNTSVIFFIVVLVKFTTPEEFDNLEGNIVLILLSCTVCI